MTKPRDGLGLPSTSRKKGARVVRLQDYQEDKERELAREQAMRSLEKIRQSMTAHYENYLMHLEELKIELAAYEEDDRLVLVGEHAVDENPEANVSFMIQFNLEQPIIDIHMIFTPEGTLKKRQKIYSVLNSWNQNYRMVAFFLDSDHDLVMRTSLDVEYRFEPAKLDEALILLSDIANYCYSEIQDFWG